MKSIRLVSRWLHILIDDFVKKIYVLSATVPLPYHVQFVREINKNEKTLLSLQFYLLQILTAHPVLVEESLYCDFSYF